MKNLLLALVIAGGLSFTACSGAKNSSSYSTVPTPVLTRFDEMYPSATDVKWKEKDGMIESSFRSGHNKVKADFTPEGDLIKACM
jgi:hypothetical protein